MNSRELLDWYQGRRVLITGHTGFKGAWLAHWLNRAGADVVGLALPPDGERPNLFTATGLDRDVPTEFVDVRDPRAVCRVVEATRPELVFHLAAQSLVRRSYAEPVSTFATNVMGTAHLLEAVRGTDTVRAVVVVTSDKCYENDGRKVGYIESDPVGGHDPYSASKGCAELVTTAYRRSFLADARVAVASARAGNVIGGGDWAADRLIPDLMMAAAAGHPAQVRHPEAVRPWQHVLEALRGYLSLGHRLIESGQQAAGSWNFGPGTEMAMPVREVVARLQERWEAVVVAYPDQPSDVHEAHYLSLDCTKAAAALDWRPALALDQALERTVRWYRQFYHAPGDARQLVDDELDWYHAHLDDESPH